MACVRLTNFYSVSVQTATNWSDSHISYGARAFSNNRAPRTFIWVKGGGLKFPVQFPSIELHVMGYRATAPKEWVAPLSPLIH